MDPSLSMPDSLPQHHMSASKLSLHCRILSALEKQTGAFISQCNRLDKSVSIRFEPVWITATRDLNVLLSSTFRCSSQYTSGSVLRARKTGRQYMGNHTWDLCGKRSILAFLSRIDKVLQRVLKLQLHNRIVQKGTVNALKPRVGALAGT